MANYANGKALEAGTAMLFDGQGQGKLVDANSWASMRRQRARPQHLDPEGHVGVGIVFRQLDLGGMAVKEVLPSSAAEACGKIVTGDVLLRVDEHDVSRADVHDVAPLVKGPIGSPVRLQFERGNLRPYEVLLARGIAQRQDEVRKPSTIVPLLCRALKWSIRGEGERNGVEFGLAGRNSFLRLRKRTLRGRSM
jgi:hypothetical protein